MDLSLRVFEAGDELQVSESPLSEIRVAQTAAAAARHNREDVHRDAFPLEERRRSHGATVAAAAAMPSTVAVVDGAWAVEAHAHQKAVSAEEARPLVRHREAVRLDHVADPLPRRAVLAHQPDRASVERQAGEGRFAPCQQNTVSSA